MGASSIDCKFADRWLCSYASVWHAGKGPSLKLDYHVLASGSSSTAREATLHSPSSHQPSCPTAFHQFKRNLINDSFVLESMVFKFRRKETPWEVVDNHTVRPVPTYFEGKPGRGLYFSTVSMHGSNFPPRIPHLCGRGSRYGRNIHFQCTQRVRHDDISSGAFFLSQTAVRGGFKKGLQRADKRKVNSFFL
jgi:hypothetical protein